MRRIRADERRARLGLRHRLAAPAASCVDVARDLLGLHSSDAASVLLAARARTNGLLAEDFERELYETRSLARVLGMRRTMFVVPVDLVPTIHAACTRDLAPRERRRLVRLLEEAGITDDGTRWLRRVEEATLNALEARGQATAVQLSHDVPELRRQILFGKGKRWESTVGVSTRVLFLLATESAHHPDAAAGLVDEHPVPVGAVAVVAGCGRRRAAHRGRADGLGTPVAGGFRSGDLRRPQVVDGLDGDPNQAGADRGRPRGGGSRRCHRVGAAPRRRSRRRPGSVGGAAAGAGPDRDGMDRARLVPRPAPGGVARSQRQRRPDRVVGRTGGRRLGAAQRRRDRPGPARRRRFRSGLGDPDRSRPAGLGGGHRQDLARRSALATWLGDVRFVPRFRTPLEQELTA